MINPAAFDLFTIGHSNHPIDRFIALLVNISVTALADVRTVPFSRRYPQFSRHALAAGLAGAGIAYAAMGDSLGGRPQDPALLSDGVADYEAMAGRPSFRAGLERVIRGATHQRMCLMCAEREPLDCHRFLLVARALAGNGLAIGHILADGTVEHHAATESRLLALAGEEATLFDDPATRLADAYRRRARKVAYRIKS